MRLYAVVWMGAFFLYFLIGLLSTPTLQGYVATHRDNLLWTSKEKVVSEADNGDILLWSTNSKIIQYVSNSPFTHISLLFRKNKCLYCWEADLGQKRRSGPRIIPLQDKMDRYKGVPLVGWKPLVRGDRPSSKRLMKIISSFAEYKMDVCAIRWCLSRLLAATPCGGGGAQKLFSARGVNRVICSELVAETLQQAGILQLDPPASQYAPGDWFNNHLALEPHTLYGPTFFFHSKKL